MSTLVAARLSAVLCFCDGKCIAHVTPARSSLAASVDDAGPTSCLPAGRTPTYVVLVGRTYAGMDTGHATVARRDRATTSEIVNVLRSNSTGSICCGFVVQQIELTESEPYGADVPPRRIWLSTPSSIV